MLNLDLLSTADMEDLAGELGEGRLEQMLASGAGEGESRLDQARAIAALHWVFRRKSDPEWTLADSKALPIDQVADEVVAGMDEPEGPKAASPDGTSGLQLSLESADG